MFISALQITALIFSCIPGLSTASFRQAEDLGTAATFMGGNECSGTEQERFDVDSLLVFADTSDPGDKARWERFASNDKLEEYREKRETYSIANVWLAEGRVAAAVFTLFSESGDWAKYVTHCFRKDGSLERASVEYRTFYGHFVMVEKQEYDRSGTLIISKKDYFDLRTDEPKNVPEEDLEANNNLMKDDVFKSVRDLAFSALIVTN
jgi:hypothetical protein